MSGPTQVYLAGSSSEAQRVARWDRALRLLGIEVVSTWPRRHPGPGMDAALPRGEQEQHARMCFREMDAATLIWVLWPPIKSGALIELGYAIATCKCLVISGPNCSESALTAVANYRDPSDDCALVEVVRIAREAHGPRLIAGATPEGDVP